MTSLPDLHLSAHAARDLGFDEVCAVLRGLCASPFGKETLASALFPSTTEALDRRVALAMEAKSAVNRKVAPDFGGLRDVRPVLDAAGKGIVLGAMDIIDAAKTLDALARLHDVLAFQGELAPLLVAEGEAIDDDRRFSRRVFRSFDETGALTDDASPELAAARARVRALRVEAQDKLQSLVRELDEIGFLRDKQFTIRNDRYVLPVKSEVQARVDGIVHDASQTNQTVFIEPRALLQIGNRIKIARAEVEQEELRILQDMTLEVKEHGPRLLADLARAGELEAAFARGAFADAVDGRAVPLTTTGLSLRNARHPLLAWMRAQADRQSSDRKGGAVVGNDIAFGGARALVITGPNAGGKTVALKTAGLVALLARSGVPASVGEGSSVPAFAAVLSSIGDAQSLEGALSSFSGQLVTLRAVLDDVDAYTGRGPVLVLLDELLSGTDPAQGAALAQAALEHLVEHGALTIATTHYERLKVLGLRGEGLAGVVDERRQFRNASVALDHEGRPTFHLVLDQAGTSNALEAARRYGMPGVLVERAASLLSPDEKELQGVLRVLAEQKEQLQARLNAVEDERAKSLEASRALERRIADVERESQRLRREGKRAFLDELAEAKRLVGQAIEAAKGGADARTLNKLSHDLQRLDEETKRDIGPAPLQGQGKGRAAELLAPSSIKVGDAVEIVSMPGNRLNILELDGDEVVVGKGPVRMRVAVELLRAPDDAPADKPKDKERRAASTSSRPPAPRGSEPKTSDNTIDVRGQRAEEALEMVEAFLDKMLRAGRSRAFILHGHGSGALKKALRAALSSSRYVKRAAPADHEDGGDALTVVELG